MTYIGVHHVMTSTDAQILILAYARVMTGLSLTTSENPNDRLQWLSSSLSSIDDTFEIR